MALKVDVTKACRQAGTEKPIDLVHLSSMTMGDPVLERDVLEMFVSHVPKYVEMLQSSEEGETARRAAHMVKGAARSIGAFRLADIAAKCEELRSVGEMEILTEIHRVEAYINSILAPQD